MITDEAKIVKALAYVDHIRDLSIRKHQREAEIETLRGELGLASSALGDRVFVSPSADAIPNAVIRLQELIKVYCTDLSEYVDEIKAFSILLSRLKPTHHRVLSMRCLNMLSYSKIASKMGYSKRTIYRIRDAALIALYEVMPEYWRSSVIPNAKDDTKCHSKMRYHVRGEVVQRGGF